MALRTFYSNPSLGGFGNESSATDICGDTAHDSDAFAQIIKELVDNAVDACSSGSQNHGPATKKRVRVNLERFLPPGIHKNDCKTGTNHHDRQTETDILRVTVSDNGCGMQNIHSCVEAFQTSKGHNDLKKHKDLTTGRYGIGLTLCLLHAQRLVTNSCASITSATFSDEAFTDANYVVDTRGNSVRCVSTKLLPKSRPDESGTSVSVLVPGGRTARMAWPRLAEYFARFRLSLNILCSLQVTAPTLSKLPLFIRLQSETLPKQQEEGSYTLTCCNNQEWTNGLIEAEDNDDIVANVSSSSKQQLKSSSLRMRRNSGDNKISFPKESDKEMDLHRIRRAVELYLDRRIPIENVSHTKVPIRVPSPNKVKHLKCPQLEVSIVACGPSDDRPDINAVSEDKQTVTHEENRFATIMLIRMVNGVPLLDSSEATSCGLVQGMAKRKVWSTVGLEVSFNHQNSTVVPKLPTFHGCDSEQALLFLQRKTHMFDMNAECESGFNSKLYEPCFSGNGSQMRHFRLPAHLRIGNLLVIAHIHADPGSLPLPTLSKGRLPVGDNAIDKAFEVALIQCLQSLQESNSHLFLTMPQLRKATRDERYVPALSSSLANIIVNSADTGLRRELRRAINTWGSSEEHARKQKFELQKFEDVQNSTDAALANSHSTEKLSSEKEDNTSKRRLGSLIEDRLHLVVAIHDNNETTSARHKKQYKRQRLQEKPEEDTETTTPLFANQMSSFSRKFEEWGDVFENCDSVSESEEAVSKRPNAQESLEGEQRRKISTGKEKNWDGDDW